MTHLQPAISPQVTVFVSQYNFNGVFSLANTTPPAFALSLLLPLQREHRWENVFVLMDDSSESDFLCFKNHQVLLYQL